MAAYNLFTSAVRSVRSVFRDRGIYIPFRRMLSATKSAAISVKVLPAGVYPTMITPFNQDKTIDWTGLTSLVDWYLSRNVDGLFAVCLSSEMYHLSNEERIELVERICKQVSGRIPVVAGATFEGDLDEQAALISAVGEQADAAIIITNQIATFAEDDSKWLSNVEYLMKKTGEIPLGLYETPEPRRRGLTTDMVRWIAESGRFVFMKDTETQLSNLKEKIQAATSIKDSPLKYFTAKLTFLNHCLEYGGHGFSGVTANFFPDPITWFYQHAKTTTDRKSHEDKLYRLSQAFSSAEAVVTRKYPTSSKAYLQKFENLPLEPVCRVHNLQMTDFDNLALEQVRNHFQDILGKS